MAGFGYGFFGSGSGAPGIRVRNAEASVVGFAMRCFEIKVYRWCSLAVLVPNHTYLDLGRLTILDASYVL